MRAIDNTPHQFTILNQIILFLLSAATLVFEINLTRIFSINQFYHFAFMIVSLALLGFGASGTVLTLFPLRGRNPDKILQTLSFGAWLSILGSYLLINRVPFDSFSIAWDLRQVGFLSIHYVALSIPFFFNGLAVGFLINTFPNRVGNVYAVNLIGAASGCIIALFAPVWVGGEGTLILSSCLAAFASLIFRRKDKQKTPQIIIRVLSLLIIILGCFEFAAIPTNTPLSSILNLQLSSYKSLSYALQFPGAKVTSQTWNSYSRIDVVESTGIRSLPGVSFKYFNPPPPEFGLFIDGDNLSPIVMAGSDLSFTNYLPTALVFKLRPNAAALILEPRGGLDVLTALNEGAKQITAVEGNELIISEALHIYNDPEVEVINETDRSYLRQNQDYFDIVILSLTNTYHPVRSGAYSLAEDYRYTVESFQDALARLAPNGILVVTRWLQIPPSEWLRAFILAATALEQTGADPSQQIAAYRSFNTGVLLIKNSPFEDEERFAIRSFTRERAFDLVYLSDLQVEEVNQFAVLESPLYYQAFSGYFDSDSPDEWVSGYPYDITPPSDDHPFFGHYFKWSQAGQIIAELGKTWQPFGGAGYFVIVIMLAIALLLSFVLIILPLIFVRITNARFVFENLPRGIMLASINYFGLIGLAYLFVEIPLIQYFILFLGHPTYSLTTVLFSILLFSGIGSRISHRIKHQPAMISLVVIILLTLLLLPVIIDITLGLPFGFRTVLTILVLAPLGVLMGMPFPNGIRKLEATAPKLIPWVWAINGAASVVASILAMLLALSFGYRWVLIAGVLCYIGAWLSAPFLRFRR